MEEERKAAAHKRCMPLDSRFADLLPGAYVYGHEPSLSHRALRLSGSGTKKQWLRQYRESKKVKKHLLKGRLEFFATMHSRVSVMWQ